MTRILKKVQHDTVQYNKVKGNLKYLTQLLEKYNMEIC